MTRLVGDLLDVARITRGKVELKLQRVELGGCSPARWRRPPLLEGEAPPAPRRRPARAPR